MSRLAQLDSLLVVADVARELNEFRPLHTTLDAICERVAHLAQHDFAALMTPDEMSRALVIRGSWQLDPEYVDAVNQQHMLPLQDGGSPVVTPTVEAYLTGKPVTIEDVQEDPRFSWKPGARRQGYRSLACFPVIVRGRVIGVLNCHGREPHRHTNDERELLELLARLAGVAMETARIADAQRAAQEELRALSEQRAEHNRQLARLTAIQNRLGEDVAQSDADAVQRTALTLAESTGRAVLVCDANGRPVTFIGPAEARSEMALVAARRDVATRLRQRPLVTADGCSCARIGVAGSGLGTIVLRPALEDERDIAALATLHAAMVMAAALQAERAGATERLRVAPPILLGLTQELYGKVQLSEITAAFGVPADAETRLAVLRCPTAEAAYRLNRRPERLRSEGWPLIAATAHETDCLLLLEPTGRERLARAAAVTRARHLEVERIGVSGTVAGLLSIPVAHRQALAAVAVDNETAGDVTFFEDHGRYGELVSDLPPGRARALVDGVLGPIHRYDAERGTQLVATLAEYVARSGALRQTAAALNVHPGTVRQRLQRAADLSGLDLHDYDSLSEVVLALNLDRMLRGSAAS